jgi:phosphate/sulfate permease
LLGREVTSTIKSGIVDPKVFADTPDVFMYGMFCALCAAAIWLLLATYLELPVSTTHSVFGCGI